MEYEDSGGFELQAFCRVESDSQLLIVYEGDKLNSFHFEAEDSGVGREQDQRKSLFKLFGRIDRDHRTGVGLGLVIIQNLVRKLSSKTGKIEEITVESQPGKIGNSPSD